MASQSPRQELLAYVETGRLRQAVQSSPQPLSTEAADLLVIVAIRYCEPRRSRPAPTPRRRK